ncbi:MAG: hypothetical protein HEQ34_14270, partial [Sphingorhabdus sp.]|uniref:hypothetical protein n=1 Tax=Sphingorhabdus sp. TaxID=1902408 RepID=UPI0025FD775F
MAILSESNMPFKTDLVCFKLGVCAKLQDQQRIEVGGAKTTMFADFVAFKFGDTVETQDVFSVLDFGDQIALQRLEAGADSRPSAGARKEELDQALRQPSSKS